MAIDRYENLPAIISELQDGAFKLVVTNTDPSVLVLGTAAKGVSGRPVAARKAQEAEARFGLEGTLVRGMYEAGAGGATNVFQMRIGAKSAILYGVGTDDMVNDPTSIETLLKDSDAASVYFVRYLNPITRGPNEQVGRLLVKNAVGQIVFDNNPGGQPIDLGEVMVSGDFTGGANIGLVSDPTSYIALDAIAQDRVTVTDTFAAVAIAPATFTLSHAPNSGSVKVLLAGVEQANDSYLVTGVTLALDVPADANAKAVVVSYDYDAAVALNLRAGSDGIDLSNMELFEALDKAYQVIETEEFKQLVPMGALLDAKNVADGDLVILSSSQRAPAGQRFPVPGSKGDALGKLFKEEYQGEVFYFWDVNGDGVAEVFPSINGSNATTKISGEALLAGDFKEVNFAYQLANACFVTSANEYNVTGVIGTGLPASMSTKDISLWVGKEPILDADGEIIANGSGLLGNKHMVGKIGYKPGFFATDLGHLPGPGAEFTGGIVKDRGQKPVDIGRFLSIYCYPQTFLNPVDATGFGYISNGAAYYSGMISSLIPQSAPTNKVAQGAESLVKLPKIKLDSLAKYHYVGLKQKNRVFRISDAPTAARPGSDFVRLSTVRVLDRIIDIVREVGEPYIGEPNNQQARLSLETNLRTRLLLEQKNNLMSRFEVSVSATSKQRIEGDCDVELVIVPPFEMKKIRVYTSLARE
jgi:archaellin